MAQLRGEEVLANDTFQELALYAAVDDDAALSARAHILANMLTLHVQWLAPPAIKSGGAKALHALGGTIWNDPVFREDMRKYAVHVGNHAAAAFIELLCDDDDPQK